MIINIYNYSDCIIREYINLQTIYVMYFTGKIWRGKILVNLDGI